MHWTYSALAAAVVAGTVAAMVAAEVEDCMSDLVAAVGTPEAGCALGSSGSSGGVAVGLQPASLPISSLLSSPACLTWVCQ